MLIKFVVDDLNETKTLGRTQSIEKILFNIKRFSPDFQTKYSEIMERGKGVTFFSIVGRFIVYLSINPTITKGDLIFFDTGNNIDIALDTVNQLFDGNRKLINQFMTIHSELPKYYDPNYELVELSIRDSIFN